MACPHISGLSDYYNQNAERPLTTLERNYHNLYLRKPGNKPQAWRKMVFEGILMAHFEQTGLASNGPASLPPSTQLPRSNPTRPNDFGDDLLGELMSLEQAVQDRAKRAKISHGGLEDQDAARLCASVLSKNVLYPHHIPKFKQIRRSCIAASPHSPSPSPSSSASTSCDHCSKPLSLCLTQGFRCLECSSSFCSDCRTTHGITKGRGHEFSTTLDSSSRLYCSACPDYVHHPSFDDARFEVDSSLLLLSPPLPPPPSQTTSASTTTTTTTSTTANSTALPPLHPPSVSRLSAADALTLTKSDLARIKFFDIDDKSFSPNSPDLTPFQARVRLLLRQRKDSQPRQTPLLQIDRPVGLYNIGNTCFMNTVLQCLMATKTVEEFFLQKSGHNFAACSQPRCLACSLDKLFLETFASSSGINVVPALQPNHEHENNGQTPTPLQLKGFPLIPNEILSTAWSIDSMKHLARYAQHDSHEYLQALLHAVGKALRTSSASANRRDKDIIEESFGGSVKNILVCSVCGETREKDEAFVNLSVEVGEMNRISPASSPSPAPRVSPNGSSNASNNNSNGNGNRSKTKTPEVIPPTTLQNCIATFTSPETIPTPLSCEKCKAKQVFSKQIKLHNLPRNLVLHLKRFRRNKKLSNTVEFPAVLDVAPFTKTGATSTVYMLNAIVNHEGGLHQGHYNCYIKKNKEWFRCQDDKVYLVEEEAVLGDNCTAYLLFYSR
ncbi:hypothetical protein TrST_g3099 [Triparma strigata]|uniref:Ubiquitinyl hydrolase 1 n=1 Tax=Triparma strigata TaxID=1606541 RepID=A0A9W7BHE2_9STRA|nr:hypothetical protein TrST_g3099 [Triparma strigata]